MPNPSPSDVIKPEVRGLSAYTLKHFDAEVKLDPKAAAIGSIEFRVEDFVPPQLKLELSAPDRPVRPGAPFPVEITARYYYGAPGAGLSLEAQATIGLDDQPYPNEPGFRFGLVDEKFAADRNDPHAREIHRMA